MTFQNRFDKHDLPQQENASLDHLRKLMLYMGVTILEHKDFLFGGTTSNDEIKLAMFQ